MNLTQQQVNSLYGRDVQDRTGARIGTVGQVWANATGQATWVSVRTGMFGRTESMAPLATARMTNAGLTVPYDKEKVRNAPRVEADAEEPLNEAETAQLYAHYQIPESPQGAPGRQQPGAAQRRATAGQEELTRSEERLRVGTEAGPAGKARLHKYVVTEDVHTTVPVEHDEVRVEREPITAENYRGERPELAEADREVILQAERPVVSRERVPVERVRLLKDEVTEEQPIDEKVRHEEVSTDLPDGRRRRSNG